MCSTPPVGSRKSPVVTMNPLAYPDFEPAASTAVSSGSCIASEELSAYLDTEGAQGGGGGGGAGEESVAGDGGLWYEVASDEYVGFSYYLNEATGEATWEKPAHFVALDHSARDGGGAEVAGAVTGGIAGAGVHAGYGESGHYPPDVVAWARAALGLSAGHEAAFLGHVCGHDSALGVTELSDLHELEGEGLALLLTLVPLAKRKKLARALEDLGTAATTREAPRSR